MKRTPVGLLDAEGKRIEPDHIADIRAQYDPKLESGELTAGDETDHVVHVPGRVVFVRNIGKLCFASLQAGTNGDRIQAMLSLNEVGLLDDVGHTDPAGGRDPLQDVLLALTGEHRGRAGRSDGGG